MLEETEAFETSDKVPLEIVKDRRFSKALIILDSRFFSKCHFDQCRLSYTGGPFEFEECSLTNCQVVLVGPAAAVLVGFERLGLHIIPPRGSRLVVAQKRV
jgi:hypothetical protein